MRLAIKLHAILTSVIMLIMIMIMIMCFYFKIPENPPLQFFIAFATVYAIASIVIFIAISDMGEDWFQTKEELDLRIQENRRLRDNIRRIETIIGEHEAVKFYNKEKDAEKDAEEETEAQRD